MGFFFYSGYFKDSYCEWVLYGGFSYKEYRMFLEGLIDFEIVLCKIYELVMVDGDLGYEYWY